MDFQLIKIVLHVAGGIGLPLLVLFLLFRKIELPMAKRKDVPLFMILVSTILIIWILAYVIIFAVPYIVSNNHLATIVGTSKTDNKRILVYQYFEPGNSIIHSIERYTLHPENYDDANFSIYRFMLAALEAFSHLDLSIEQFELMSFDRKIWISKESHIREIKEDTKLVIVDKSSITNDRDIDFHWFVASSHELFR